jgi:predicted nucleic acid-binding protein
VFDETVTLLRKRLGWAAACEFGNRLKGSDFVSLVYIAAGDEERAWDIFRKYRDKDLSYTDCTSFAVMERLNLKTAFTFDRHFSALQYQAVPAEK